jgi:hypothetical protein
MRFFGLRVLPTLLALPYLSACYALHQIHLVGSLFRAPCRGSQYTATQDYPVYLSRLAKMALYDAPGGA